MKKLAILCAAIACSAPLAVQANTVTYTGTFSGTTDRTNLPVSVNKFNPALGILQSASFTLGAAMNSQLTAANDGDFDVLWKATKFEFSLAGKTPYSDMFIAASAPATFLDWANITATSPGNVWISPGVYEYKHNAPTLMAGNTFLRGASSDFVGAGTLDFLLTTLNWHTLGLSGQSTGGIPPGTSSLRTTIDSNVSVTYTYAVPEPDAYALLLSGLGLMGFVAYRRKQGAV